MIKTINYSVTEDNFAVIKLNRPEKRNAVSLDMADTLKSYLHKAKQEKIKFLVITGEGNDMFCAGGDLNDLHGDLTTEDAFSKLYKMKEVLYDVVSFPVPTICLLNGNALGGGCELATACDIRISKQSASFGFVQTNLGITPGWGGGALLYEKVNPNFAFNWVLGASVYSAAHLHSQGWIHSVVDDDSWDDQSKLLKPYIRKSYDQMKILKRQYMKKLSILGLSTLMDEEVRNCACLWESDEHKQAVRRFFKQK